MSISWPIGQLQRSVEVECHAKWKRNWSNSCALCFRMVRQGYRGWWFLQGGWYVFRPPFGAGSIMLVSFRLWHGNTENVRPTGTVWLWRSMRVHNLQLQKSVYVLLPGRSLQCCPQDKWSASKTFCDAVSANFIILVSNNLSLKCD